MRTPPVLEVRDLSVTYQSQSGPVHAVRDASLELSAGETLALAGETGSGKSTIALSILGLLERHDQKGEILYKGREIQSLPEREWKKIRSSEMGMVFQDARGALNPVLTVLDHLMETLRTHRKPSRKDARARALDLLQEIGIQQGQEKLHPFELSGGTCQRVGIALAICNRPQLLIADEPTSAVDTAIQAQILDLLQRMKQRYKLSLLLISHDLPLISQVSDRIAVMYHGRIVESGTKDEILRSPKHPYSCGLVECQPSFSHHHEHNPVAAIPGAMPNPGEQFQGCAFAPRCHRSEPRCLETTPNMRQISNTRRVACIHA